MEMEDLLSRVERRPSPIHGRGLFARRPIKRGRYSASRRTHPSFGEALSILTSSNSPLAPPLVELLTSRGSPPMSMTDRLALLREGFAAFVEEEKSLAVFDYGFGLLPGRDPSELTVLVHRDINEGEELLRSYGYEWMAMKYYHFRVNHQRAERSIPSGGGVTFVSGKDGTCTGLTTVLKEGETPSQIEERMKGRGVRVVPIEELGDWARLLGTLGLERFRKGDLNFDLVWKKNVEEAEKAETESLGRGR